MPCPIDPRHSVFASRLKHHLKICTKLRDDYVLTRQPFYREGVNLSNGDCAVELESAVRLGEDEKASAEEWAERVKDAYHQAVQDVLGSAVDPAALIEASVVEEASDVKHAEKHEAQNEALAGLVTDLVTDSAAIVEYGCGRAGFAASILESCPTARCVLLDRDTRRHKIENKQDHRQERVLRLRLDIANFDLGAFLKPLDAEALPKAADFEGPSLTRSGPASKGQGPAERLEEQWRAASEIQSAPWPPDRLIACAKHLCGGATDISLRSLRDRGGAEAIVCVATCCHHRCDTATYVNLPFLRRLGLGSSADFARLAGMAGTAVGGASGAAGLEKRRLGMMAKRLLDLGRVAWLQDELGMDASLTHFIAKAVTPENVAIVAGLPTRGV